MTYICDYCGNELSPEEDRKLICPECGRVAKEQTILNTSDPEYNELIPLFE